MIGRISVDHGQLGVQEADVRSSLQLQFVCRRVNITLGARSEYPGVQICIAATQQGEGPHVARGLCRVRIIQSTKRSCNRHEACAAPQSIIVKPHVLLLTAEIQSGHL